VVDGPTDPDAHGRFDESVTVVIPTKNRLGYVRRAVQLARLQQVPALEIVVVDDGGDDGTPDFVESLGDRRVKVVRHPHSKGVSAARNSGLEAATGAWVAFVDDDDMWSPRKLAVQLAALRADRSARWSSVGCVEVGERWQVFTEILPPRDDVVRRLLARNVIPGGGSGTIVARDILNRVGGFDERLSTLADWDMWIRISRRYAVVRCPDLNVGYMRHSDNMHLAGDQFAREMTHFRTVHGPAAAARGRQLLGDAFPLHVAAAYRARGQRLLASAWYLRGFWNTRRPRHLALAAGVLLGERAIEMSGLRQAPGPPPAVEWLQSIQQLQENVGSVSEIAG
jgi:glycosyltransferase involved in cell wall biosynthesis